MCTEKKNIRSQYLSNFFKLLSLPALFFALFSPSVSCAAPITSYQLTVEYFDTNMSWYNPSTFHFWLQDNDPNPSTFGMSYPIFSDEISVSTGSKTLTFDLSLENLADFYFLLSGNIYPFESYGVQASRPSIFLALPPVFDGNYAYLLENGPPQISLQTLSPQNQLSGTLEIIDGLYYSQNPGSYASYVVGSWAISSSAAVVIPTPTPEPSSLLMLGLGITGLGALIWRRRSSQAI